MMPPMPAPAPQDQPMMPCPHCKGPLNLSKGMPAGPMPPMDKKPMPNMDKKSDKPAKKKNASNMPMDELKAVIKGQGKPHDDGF